ncbi:MAG: aminotransferase class I/II-fold pyridoxal phosphate-dependent enzyme, partial [Candidatus Aureabacteria bacterium]|nr:aminotransferase class I/II-fold pyridoxal phosphate-dependent enzyme [Candidatus Auribacterota bacterium]
ENRYPNETRKNPFLSGLTPAMPYPRFRVFMPISELALSLIDALRGVGMEKTGEFASAFAGAAGLDRAIPVASGRAGFRLLLEEMGIPRGSEIVFPAYTFHPMPVVAAERGLKPVFADVDPRTWTISPEAFLSRVSPRTKAVAPTHLFGVPADMDRILAIARAKGIVVIEDCAHALGATFRGRAVGSFGDAALFTFAMSKSLPCWGGGAVAVKDAALAERMASRLEGSPSPSGLSVLREQASNILALLLTQPALFPWTLYPLIKPATWTGISRFDEPFLEEVSPPSAPPGKQSSVISNQSSVNSDQSSVISNQTKPKLITDHWSLITAMSPFQAMVGLRQLQRFPSYIVRQMRNARLLRERLAGVSGIELQAEPPEAGASFLYVRVRVDDPVAFRRALLSAGVDTKPDDMRDCASLGIFGEQPPCPNAARLSGHCIELPCSPFYSEEEMVDIARRTKTALTRY